MNSGEAFPVGCHVCGDTETQLIHYYGVDMCEQCVTIERETDWDKFEADKRKRIFESQEY